MPKEITHLIIARNVLNRLKRFRPASNPNIGTEIIENHKQAFFLGAIIPDAFFYNLLPWPRVLEKGGTVSSALHLENRDHNDERTKNLLTTALTESSFSSLKAAFSAGMITHTVSDRIFHDVIDYYTNLWGESGTQALGTHRQLETLFDTIFLNMTGETVADFPLEASVSLSPFEENCLFQFSVTRLLHPPPVLHRSLARAFKWAHTQQLFLLRLFRKATAFRIAHLARRFTAGRSELISGLFYPPAISSETFPILERLNVARLRDGKDFEGNLATLAQRITDQAVRYIQIGLG